MSLLQSFKYDDETRLGKINKAETSSKTIRNEKEYYGPRWSSESEGAGIWLQDRSCNHAAIGERAVRGEGDRTKSRPDKTLVHDPKTHRRKLSDGP